MKHLLPTSNIVERLFSRAKIILADRRKRMSPYHLELLLFLRINRDLWNANDIQNILHHFAEQAAAAAPARVLQAQAQGQIGLDGAEPNVAVVP
jgi:hypothetical protein